MSATIRFWEVDFLRGCMILATVIFHYLWDCVYFYRWNLELHGNTAILTTSLLLVGICLSIGSIQKNAPFLKYCARGIKIFVFAFTVSIVTFLYDPISYVRFGVLHCIGVSSILVYLFKDLRYFCGFLGCFFISLGIFLEQYCVDSSWGLIFGLLPCNSSSISIDYVPIFPYFGVVLLGVFLGNVFYNSTGRNFPFISQPKNFLVASLVYMGRHSLIIYLTHQVILHLIFYLYEIWLR